MGEWLNQQFAKLSFLAGRVGSNPTTSAKQYNIHVGEWSKPLDCKSSIRWFDSSRVFQKRGILCFIGHATYANTYMMSVTQEPSGKGFQKTGAAHIVALQKIVLY
jgi:hypothetical protein